MSKLSPTQLAERKRLDHRVVMEMARRSDLIEVRPFVNMDDLRSGDRAICPEDDSARANHYLVHYAVRTLAGPDRILDATTVHIDLLAGGNYPYSEPACWVLSRPLPWTPHFREGAPICLGELWQEARGQVLLAHLVRHLAKLLNFDELERHAGYRGWNGAAIDHWRDKLRARPITPGLRYPEPAVELTHGVTSRRAFTTRSTNRRRTFTAR